MLLAGSLKFLRSPRFCPDAPGDDAAMGVQPRGAQVLATKGANKKPDSSAKTKWAPSRAAFFLLLASLSRFQRSMALSFLSSARCSGFW